MAAGESLAGPSVATILVLGILQLCPNAVRSLRQLWSVQAGRLTGNPMEKVVVMLFMQTRHGGPFGVGLRHAALAPIDLGQTVVRVGSGGIQAQRLAKFACSGFILLAAGEYDTPIPVHDANFRI